MSKQASAAVHPAAPKALAASRFCGVARSARLNSVEMTAPTTNPTCTEAVSQTAAVAPMPHSERRLGTTAVAENQTLSPNTWTSAMSVRWLLIRESMIVQCDSGCGHLVKGEQLVDFWPHRMAQLPKVPPQLRQVPVVARDALGDAEQRLGQAVTGALVIAESLELKVTTVGCSEDCPGEQFRVAQGVRDAVRGNRVLEIAGVAHQRPTWARRGADPAGLTGKRTQRADRRYSTDRAGQLGGGFSEQRPIGGVEARRPLPGEPVAGGADPNGGQAIVGRHDSGGYARSVHPVVVIAGKSGEVAVEERAEFRAPSAQRRVDSPRDRRVASVGANRQRCGRTETNAGPALDSLDAVHPPVVGQDARHPRGDANLGACHAGGFEQQRIENGSTRGVQRRYATARTDVDGLDFVVPVGELGRTNGRCARVDDRVEQTPTVQLQHTAAHECVGG